MSEDTVNISVALVTRNRPESLARALRSLRAQNASFFEIVVSDDSDPGPAVLTKRVAEEYGCRYVEGRRCGLYANRNSAALACRGTHIRTMDDDHELPPDHIALCQRAVQSDPEAVWVIGEHYPESQSLTVPPPPPGQIGPRGSASPPLDLEHSWAIADGSTVFPSSVFRRGILYSEAFKFGCAFYEFGSRLHYLGYHTRFLETTYVLHHSQEFERAGLTVWAGGDETAMASQYFTIMCHSFIYQPTFANMVSTSAKIMKNFLTKPASSVVAFQRAFGAYASHRRHLRHLVGRS